MVGAGEEGMWGGDPCGRPRSLTYGYTSGGRPRASLSVPIDAITVFGRQNHQETYPVYNEVVGGAGTAGTRTKTLPDASTLVSRRGRGPV